MGRGRAEARRNAFLAMAVRWNLCVPPWKRPNSEVGKRKTTIISNCGKKSLLRARQVLCIYGSYCLIYSNLLFA